MAYFTQGVHMVSVSLRCLGVAALTIVWSSQAWSFAREFNQDNDPSVFHAESSAELCLFVRSRQGILMIQPHCMVSSSSHSVPASAQTTARNDSSSQR